MKKIFLITALLAIGTATLAGCGGQSNENPTQDKPSQSTRIQRDIATDQPQDEDTSKEECPDGKCPEHCPPRDEKKRRCPESRVYRREIEFIFRAPAPEFFKGVNSPTETTSDTDKQLPENGDKSVRDRRPPRSRMPGKLQNEKQTTPEPIGGN